MTISNSMFSSREPQLRWKRQFKKVFNFIYIGSCEYDSHVQGSVFKISFFSRFGCCNVGCFFGATEFVNGATGLFGFPSLVLGGQTAKAVLHQFDTPFENQINAGVMQISLEKTTISEIQNHFGGDVQSHTAMGKGTTGYVMISMSMD
ncbi:hypothetical protein HED63_25175 [Ochrobactrum cytisi]|nr:hypothetical protein [Brucella cytisi]